MIRSMFIPSTLYIIEASFLADASLSCTLPFFWVVWSCRQPLACLVRFQGCIVCLIASLRAALAMACAFSC